MSSSLRIELLSVLYPPGEDWPDDDVLVDKLFAVLHKFISRHIDTMPAPPPGFDVDIERESLDEVLDRKVTELEELCLQEGLTKPTSR